MATDAFQRRRRFDIRRPVVIAAGSASIVLITAVVWLLAMRPRTIALFVSPDGKWRLLIRDIDSDPHQVRAAYSIEESSSGRELPGSPFVKYYDSVDPPFETPMWTADTVRLNGLVGRFGPDGQAWSVE